MWRTCFFNIYADVLWLTQTLSDEGVQHVLVTGSEALSGKWVTDEVKTGVDSWRPLHLLLMCSVTCIMSALTQVSNTLLSQIFITFTKHLYTCMYNSVCVCVCV